MLVIANLALSARISSVHVMQSWSRAAVAGFGVSVLTLLVICDSLHGVVEHAGHQYGGGGQGGGPVPCHHWYAAIILPLQVHHLDLSESASLFKLLPQSEGLTALGGSHFYPCDILVVVRHRFTGVFLSRNVGWEGPGGTAPCLSMRLPHSAPAPAG